MGETLKPRAARLRATAQGETETVLATVRSVPGICKVELESAADGQVTFTAESEDAATPRCCVPGTDRGRVHRAGTCHREPQP